MDSDFETQLKSDTSRFTHSSTRYPVHTIDNEIQSSPWLIKPISGVMRRISIAKRIRATQAVWQESESLERKNQIKDSWAKLQQQHSRTKVLLTRSTRLRGSLATLFYPWTFVNQVLICYEKETSYTFNQCITKSTTRLKLKKERQSYQQQQQHLFRQLDKYRRHRFYYVLMSFAHEMTVA